MTEIKPIEDRVLVLPDSVATVTRSGIHIPENVRSKYRTGIVLAAGPGKRSEKTGVVIEHGIRPGDRAYFAEMAGASIHVDGTEHFVLRAEEVLAVETLP